MGVFRRTIALTSVKMAALAPMPMASDISATPAKGRPPRQ